MFDYSGMARNAIQPGFGLQQGMGGMGQGQIPPWLQQMLMGHGGMGGGMQQPFMGMGGGMQPDIFRGQFGQMPLGGMPGRGGPPVGPGGPNAPPFNPFAR